MHLSQAMVLFATDVAARGLDFPTIDWVLQARPVQQPCSQCTWLEGEDCSRSYTAIARDHLVQSGVKHLSDFSMTCGRRALTPSVPAHLSDAIHVHVVADVRVALTATL